MWSQLIAQVLPALVDALTPLLVAVLVGLIYRWTGIQIEQKHMLALQSALQNGARLMLKPNASIEEAIAYVQASVPDALAKFRAGDPSRIAELLAPHIAVLPKPRLPIGDGAMTQVVIDGVKNRARGATPGAVE
ncbi:hypothetical protein [Shinella sp. M31]|uniref:hypothetical protein n=1 Tax=Shinella sp. M31 TaxID=3368615 RepID=UPI003BA356B4